MKTENYAPPLSQRYFQYLASINHNLASFHSKCVKEDGSKDMSVWNDIRNEILVMFADLLEESDNT